MHFKRLFRSQSGKGVLLPLALVAVIVCCAVVTYTYWQQLTVPPAPTAPIEGNLSLDFVELNTFDRTSVSTTSPAYTAFHCNGQWPITAVTQLGSSVTITAGTAKTIGISSLDQSVLAIKVYAGTGHFVDVKGMLAAHPRVLTDYCFTDVTGDGYLDIIYKMDLATLGINKQSAQSYQISVLTVPNDRSSASLSAPADKSGVGTGAKTVTITWELSAFGEKKGGAIAKCYIVQNRTDEDYAKLDSFGVSYGDAYLPLSKTGYITYDTGAKRWNIDLGVKDYRQVVYAMLYGRSTGGPEKVSFTAVFKTNFTATGSGNAVIVTFYVQENDPSSALPAVRSDTGGVTISA